MKTILKHARDFAELFLVTLGTLGFAAMAAGLIEAYAGAWR